MRKIEKMNPDKQRKNDRKTYGGERSIKDKKPQRGRKQTDYA